MWPLPEPTRPAGATRWDPPVLVRLELDHGLGDGPTRTSNHVSSHPGADRRPRTTGPRPDHRRG